MITSARAVLESSRTCFGDFSTSCERCVLTIVSGRRSHQDDDGGRQDDDGEEAIAQKPLDRTDMLQYGGRLRRFTPKELLNLFGFPLDYHFPSEIKLEHQYKLIGNSINVTVVTALVNELLFGEEEESNVGDEKGHMVEL